MADQLVDKMIRCGDCGKEFEFTIKEQEFFKSKGYDNDPKRCRNCRRQRRMDGDRDRHDRAQDRMDRGRVDEPRTGRRR